jgi:hypothetical protein
LYYQINEGIGIEKKVEITPNNATSKDYVNYVLIPQEKDYLISSLSL